MIRKFREAMLVLVVLIAVSGAFPPKAHAYLDPGTGSYVLQLLIAALLAAVVTVKMYWGRIKAFVSGLFSKKSEDEPAPD